MVNNLLYRRCYQFTQEDREACLPVVEAIIALAHRGRRDGILGIEQDITPAMHPFLNLGISLIVDGTDPALVRQILESLILSENHAEAPLLKRLIMLEGILEIQQGTNPYMIETMLLSLLGETIVNSHLLKKKNLSAFHCTRADLLSDFQEGAAYSKEFESYFDRLHDRDLQLVLRYTKTETAAAALAGCGTPQKMKLLNNVSLNTAAALHGHWQHGAYTQKHISESQQEILSIARLLENTGEIIIFSDKTNPAPQ